MSPDILVVDDDEAILMTIAEILRDEGYAVRTANNGVEALTAIEQQLPMLLLLDMRMPVLDGWSVARSLRERGIQLPMIVMTAAHDTRWGQEVGADETLAKPFNLVDLLAGVARIMARAP
jgi:two-component system, OmpR family, response regulator MprA